MFNLTVPDKKVVKVLPKDYVMCTDEAECIAIAVGRFWAIGEISNIYISADGFLNTLNYLTSLVIPKKIPMRLFISIGRTEEQHYVATELVPKIIRHLKKYDTEGISYKLVK